MKELFKCMGMYLNACGLKKYEEDVTLIQKKLDVNYDIPIIFVGLLKELCFEKPQAYWKRDVANEIRSNIDDYISTDSELFLLSFNNSAIEFFESIRAYESITRIISEIRNVAFEQSFKTRIFRNPIFSQLCEDFLMNMYRVLKSIVNQFSEKDYSSQNTLTPIIQCLSKNGFVKSTDINVDLRNSVNHGNVFTSGSTINYRFGNAPDYKIKTINCWEYDDLINQTYDTACGILVGIIQSLSKNPSILESIVIIPDKNAFEWFKLMYKNEKVKVLDVSEVDLKSRQISINIETHIEKKEDLIIALIELTRSSFLLFPNYDRYFVGYEHRRSCSGYIRLTNKQLIKGLNAIELYKLAVDSNDVMISDIMDADININAYKYHIFPKIKTREYEVIDVQDISVGDFKRLKANLIIGERACKSDIWSIVKNVIFELKSFETPQNPFINISWGKSQADMVFLNVFVDSLERNNFNLFPNNSSFVGLAHFYKDESCPRLQNGGVMENLWRVYKKDKMKDGIVMAWNPKYKNTLA